MNAKPKVLQILGNPAIGGTETFVLATSNFLRRSGMDVRIANFWDDSDVADLADREGIPYIQLRGGKRRFRLTSLARLYALQREEQFDVICGYGLRVSLIVRFVATICPQVVFITGLRGIDTWRRRRHVWIDRWTQNLVDYFVGCSQEVCMTRHRREKTPMNRLICISNGIDSQYFCPHGPKWPSRKQLGLPNGRLCVTVANFRPHKGHAFLLHALSRIPDIPEDVHFLWVGSGASEQMLKDTAAKLGLADRISFYGAVRDVRPILAASEFFILPSREEGMPRALMEAMAMELVCLATDVGGTAEVLRDGIEGFLVPYGDVDSAAARMKEMLKFGASRKQFGLNARRRICNEFDLRRHAEKYAEVYTALLLGRQEAHKFTMAAT